MILATVDLQVTSILPMNFWVSCLFGSGEKVQNRFSRRPPWPQFGISYRNDLNNFFYLQVTLMLPTTFRVNMPFSSEEEGKNRFSRWPPWPQFGISYHNDLRNFFIYKSLWCFLPRFESICFSVQKKKGKIDFQDDCHLGFPIGTILAIFISTSHPDAS